MLGDGTFHHLTLPQQLALTTVERDVRSARTALLTINIICGFLFILYFEVLFGWQLIRPSASNVFFVHQLAELAALHRPPEDTDNSLTRMEHAIISLAHDYVASMPCPRLCYSSKVRDSAQKSVEDLKKCLSATLDNKPTFFREEFLATFVRDLNRLETLFAEDPVADLPNDTVSPSDSHFTNAILSTKNLSIRNPTILHAVQEIRDRATVNEKSRGRRIGPRKYEMPVFGIQTQLEDVSPPIAAILLFLVFWLRSSVLKVAESIRVTERFFHYDKRTMARFIANMFFFLELPRSDQSIERCPLSFKNRVIFLFITPCLIVALGYIANLGEFIVRDYQIHGIYDYLDSDVAWAFYLFLLFQIAASLFLLRLANKMSGEFLSVYFRLKAHLQKEAPPETEVSKSNAQKIRRVTGTLFATTLIAPVAFWVCTFFHKPEARSYFPTWLAWSILVVVFAACIVLVNQTLKVKWEEW